MVPRTFESRNRLEARLRSSRIVRAAYNAWTIAVRHRREALRRPFEVARFLLTTPELSTWTYELENGDELLAVAAGLLGRSAEELRGYAQELRQDEQLRERLRRRLATRRDRSSEPRYGKRVIYYALARSLAPAVIAETGTNDGLGAAVIAAALRRNAREGRPGRLLTFDVNPNTGWLLSEEDRQTVTQHIGLTSETLVPALQAAGVDFFIHDSQRTVENERFEYDTALSCARGAQLLVACDDLRSTDVLEDLCATRGAELVHLRERPARHWWPGNDVGLARLPLP